MHKMYMKPFLFILCILFFSCSKSSLQSTNTDSTSFSYLALGDSYTIGTSVANSKNFPRQLIDSLSNYGLKNEKFDILATNGWTTANLINGLNNANFNIKAYDLVSLLIGVNNQYRGQPIETFETEFRILIDRAISYSKLGKSHVVIVSIPDYSVTPFVSEGNKTKVEQEIKMYNDLSKKIADELEITYIDITPISKKAKDDLTLLASDNLHPSVKMYSLWVNLMINDILEILK